MFLRDFLKLKVKLFSKAILKTFKIRISLPHWSNNMKNIGSDKVMECWSVVYLLIDYKATTCVNQS